MAAADDGCLAVLGFIAVGKRYYDVQVKRRARLFPFILWVNQHRHALIEKAVKAPDQFELAGRTFCTTNTESHVDSNFVVNLDNDTWRDTGLAPFYIDWGDIWQYSKYGPHCYTLLWDMLPTWERYHNGSYIDPKYKKIALGDCWGYDYRACDAIVTQSKIVPTQ